MLGIVFLTAFFAFSWLLPLKYGRRGLIGFYFFLLPAFVIIITLVGHHENPTEEVLLPALAGFGILVALMLPLSIMGFRQRTATDRPLARWNPRISPFWLWLAIAFGVIALTPIFCFPEKLGEGTRYLPVVTAYSRPDLIDYPPALILLCHVLLSIALAAFATTIQRRILDNRRKR